MEPLLEQCKKWKVKLEAYCKRSFPRVRITKGKCKPSEADKYIHKRNKLKQKEESDRISHTEQIELIELENIIANILAVEGRAKHNQFKKFCIKNGSVSVSEMWKLKKQLWPKKAESIQTGKINFQGKLVTGPEEIKKLIESEYNNRLRQRSVHPDMEEINELKKETFKVKLEKTKLSISPDWTIKD